MADMNQSYVVLDKITEDVRKNFKTVRATITVPQTDATPYGNSSATIPASYFGLDFIYAVLSCVTTVSGSDKIVLATPSAAFGHLYTYDLNQATDAQRYNQSPMIKRIDASTPGVFKVVLLGW